MAENITEEFIDALEKLETGDDIDTIAGLFADNCEVGNVTLSKTLHGTEGAKEFWTHYKSTLGDVRSVFKNKIVSDGTSALEWTTEGETESGEHHINYEGVSILETEGGKITRFFAYFNPNKLGNQITEAQHG